MNPLTYSYQDIKYLIMFKYYFNPCTTLLTELRLIFT